MEHLRQIWARSKWFRVTLTAAIVYTVLRLAVQAIILVIMMFPGQFGMEMPDWVGSKGAIIPDDLRIYLDAAEKLRLQQDLYLKGAPDRMEFYQYAPSYALAFIPFLWMPRNLAAIVHTLLHIIVYALLYLCWNQIFRRLRLERASEMLA
jgi:hypothetical protein